MTGKSPVTATDEQKAALKALGHCADRAEADRARALLLTLDGWTSARIAQPTLPKRVNRRTSPRGSAPSATCPPSCRASKRS